MINNIMSKRRLWVYMNSKLRGLIHSYATIAVLNILFEEMIADLKAGKTIEIFNFCTFNVKIGNHIKYLIFTMELSK